MTKLNKTYFTIFFPSSIHHRIHPAPVHARRADNPSSTAGMHSVLSDNKAVTGKRGMARSGTDPVC